MWRGLTRHWLAPWNELQMRAGEARPHGVSAEAFSEDYRLRRVGGFFVIRVCFGGATGVQGFPRDARVIGLAAYLKRSSAADSRRTSASRARMHSSVLRCGPSVVSTPHDGHRSTTCDGGVSFLCTDMSKGAIAWPLQNGAICGRPVNVRGRERVEMKTLLCRSKRLR